MNRRLGLLFLVCLIIVSPLRVQAFFEGPLCYPLGWLVQPFGLCEVPLVEETAPPVLPSPAPSLETDFSVEAPPRTAVPAAPPQAVFERLSEQTLYQLVEQTPVTRYVTTQTIGVSEADVANVYAYIDSQLAALLLITSLNTSAPSVSPQSVRSLRNDYATQDYVLDSLDKLYDKLSDTRQDLSADLTDGLAAAGQWETSGDDIYRLTGNVGVGTGNPQTRLHVGSDASPLFYSSQVLIAGNTNGPNGLEVQNTFAGGTADTRLSAIADDGSYVSLMQPSSINAQTLFGTQRSSASFLFNAGGTRDLVLGTISNNALILGTENRERLRIDNNGNVGIGTTTPNNLLTVAGTIGATTLCDANGGNCASVTALTSGTSPWSQSGSDIYYTAGNVGIGTSTPSSKLNIAQSNDTNGLVISGFDDRVSDTLSLYVDMNGDSIISQNKTSGGSGYLTLLADNYINLNPGTFTYTQRPLIMYDNTQLALGTGADFNLTYNSVGDRLDIFDAGSGSGLTVATGGNVGIGTTTPVAKLSVQAGSGPLLSLNSTAAERFNVGFGGGVTINANDTTALSIRNNSGPGNLLEVETDKFLIDNNGNVGIGTNSLSDLFTVAGTARANAFTINGPGGSDVELTTNGDSGLTVKQTTNVTNGNSIFSVLDENDNNRFFVSEQGEVGIGTTTPAAKLHLNESAFGTYNALVIGADAGTNGIISGIEFQRNFYDSVGRAAAIQLARNGGGQDGELLFSTNSGSGGLVERLRITKSGLIGIGTTTPSARLNIVTVANGGDDTFVIDRLNGSRLFSIKENGDVEINGTSANLSVAGNISAQNGYIGQSVNNNLNFVSGTGYLNAGNNFNIAIDSVNNSTSDFFSISHDAQNGAGAELFRVQENGNVGIGTTTPTQALSVVGDAQLSGVGVKLLLQGLARTGYIEQGTNNLNLGVDGIRVLSLNSAVGDSYLINSDFAIGTTSNSQNAALTVQTDSTNDILNLFETGGQEVFTVLENGNVGIGTSTPNKKLSVRGGSMLIETINSPPYDSAIEFKPSYGTYMPNGHVIKTQFNAPGGINNAMLFRTAFRTDDSPELMLRAGSVGIGTSTPASKLDVWGDLRVGDGATPELFVNTSANFVGIGTNTNTYSSKLAVAGSINATGVIAYRLGTTRSTTLGNSGGNPQIQFLNQDGFDAEWEFGFALNSGDTKDLELRVTDQISGAKTVFTVDNNSGNFAIGTSSPSAQLTVNDTVRFASITGGTLETDALGNVTVSSDERLKDIKGAYTAGLDEVLALRPIEYRWNKQSGYDMGTLYAGFSAQNVESVIPEAVGENGDGFKTLSTRPILAAVVTAVQEMWDAIMGNTEAIESLESENEALRARLEAIEARLDIDTAPQPEPAETAKLETNTPNEDTADTDSSAATSSPKASDIDTASTTEEVVDEELVVAEDVAVEPEPGIPAEEEEEVAVEPGSEEVVEPEV